MTTLVFEMADINKLIEEIRTAKTFSVTADQIYDPACYPGGALLNAGGQTEEEARKAGRVFFPSSSKIASTHLVPKVLLAHSHGVYLITNAELEGSPASRDTVAYAQGMNPKLDEDWDYACDAALGGSDCSYTIPVEWLELAVEQGFQEFRLRMSETKIKLVTK
ncbi:DUF3085 domain-containing protein [Salmonella enterica subsp. enterica serovar Typhimurium]|nr:DUF3085 domain-containing protein [Salmonella enterica subsp. enterica serovar Typhimurium]